MYVVLEITNSYQPCSVMLHTHLPCKHHSLLYAERERVWSHDNHVVDMAEYYQPQSLHIAANFN